MLPSRVLIMRYLLFALLVVAVGNTALAKENGYRINLKFTDKSNAKVYLAHYFAEPLPRIYRVDSTQIDANGKGVISSDEKMFGGIYLIVLDDNKTYFEFIYNNGDELDMTVTTSKLPFGVSYKNSPENDRFLSYMSYLNEMGGKQQEVLAKLKDAKTAKDTAILRQDYAKQTDKIKNYRENYIQKYPKTLLANIMGALLVPEIPEEKHYFEDGTLDSTYGYRYYKEHYWDNFDFTDDRLVYTPLYDSKLDYYFTNVVMKLADSVAYEGDKLLEKARSANEVFKYTLHWLANYTQKSDIMGLDAAFVHFVENYYMKGDAFWLSPGTLQKYIDRAQNIAPNVIGNIAPPLKMRDLDSNFKQLHDIDAPYTMIVFWSPTCGHCLSEVPKLDSLYKAELKEKGVQIYAVNVDRDDIAVAKWKEVIKEKNIDYWINVYDPDKKSPYRSQYDVYGTPRVYLLNKQKKIIGKNLDHTNIMQVIEIEETKS